MNKKLVLASALVFGVAGLILAQGSVKAQENAENAVANTEVVANTDAPAMNAEAANTEAVNAEAPAMNAEAPANAEAAK